MDKIKEFITRHQKTLGKISGDEFFAWYAGYASGDIKMTKRLHIKVHCYVERYGLGAIFVLALLPLPGFVYAISGFAAGHYKIPFWKFFLVNFSGKFLRTGLIILTLISVIDKLPFKF